MARRFFVPHIIWTLSVFFNLISRLLEKDYEVCQNDYNNNIDNDENVSISSLLTLKLIDAVSFHLKSSYHICIFFSAWSYSWWWQSTSINNYLSTPFLSYQSDPSIFTRIKVFFAHLMQRIKKWETIFLLSMKYYSKFIKKLNIYRIRHVLLALYLRRELSSCCEWPLTIYFKNINKLSI